MRLRRTASTAVLNSGSSRQQLVEALTGDDDRLHLGVGDHGGNPAQAVQGAPIGGPELAREVAGTDLGDRPAAALDTGLAGANHIEAAVRPAALDQRLPGCERHRPAGGEQARLLLDGEAVERRVRGAVSAHGAMIP